MTAAITAIAQKQLQEIHEEAQTVQYELLQAMQAILAQCDALMDEAQETEASEQVNEACMAIYQACTVQDVLRQRMDKVQRLVQRLQEGSDAVDDPLLEGPQHGAGSLTQEHVNKLLEEEK